MSICALCAPERKSLVKREIILVSHGPLATGMMEAVKLVAGDPGNIRAFGLMPGSHPDSITEEVRSIVQDSPDCGTEYVIITDFLGGSMANSIMKLCLLDRVYVVSGMNISLVLELALGDEDTPTASLIEVTMQRARDSIVRIDKSELLGNAKKGEEDELWS
jgi:mannose/fructose-specific phosphotransferase system component IIA